MDTSGLAGSAGAIDLSFNPGLLSGTQSATATVTQFAGATIDSAHGASNTGDASGALPGSLQFDNGTQLNEIFTPVIFGSSFDFVLTLGGPAVNNPEPNATYGSTFVLGLFSTDGNTPLVTKDGIIATLDLAPGSTATTPQTFTPDASIGPITPVPEPSAVGFVAFALTAVLTSRYLNWAKTSRA